MSEIKLNIPARFEKVQVKDIPKSVLKVIDDMKKSRKGLFLHGNVGTGKTHIAYAVMKYVRLEKNILVRVYNSADLLNEIRDSYDNQGNFLERLKEFRGLLIIDDIGAERITDWVAEQFYILVNQKYNDMIPVMFTSNYDLSQLSERIGERIVSRIVEMCEVLQLDGKDRRLG